MLPLRGLRATIYLRRLKTDKQVIADLPDKTEVERLLRAGQAPGRAICQMVAELAAVLEGLEGIKRRGMVLAYLMRFKQLCNHPVSTAGRRRDSSRTTAASSPARGDLSKRFLAAGESARSSRSSAK